MPGKPYRPPAKGHGGELFLQVWIQVVYRTDGTNVPKPRGLPQAQTTGDGSPAVPVPGKTGVKHSARSSSFKDTGVDTPARPLTNSSKWIWENCDNTRLSTGQTGAVPTVPAFPPHNPLYFSCAAFGSCGCFKAPALHGIPETNCCTAECRAKTKATGKIQIPPS